MIIYDNIFFKIGSLIPFSNVNALFTGINVSTLLLLMILEDELLKFNKLFGIFLLLFKN